MPFNSRSFWYPKDEGHPAEYEDAFAVGDQRGIAAVADGVAGGIFSGRWARLLTQGAVENPPDPRDPNALRGWYEPLRAEWDAGIDRAKLGFFQRQRLQQVGGGYATLQWLELLPAEPPEDDGGQEEEDIPYRSFAVGDCCLFHVRDGEVLRTFPMEKSKDFALDPQSIGSVDRKQDRSLKFEALEGSCRCGDLLVLASDALAWWVIRQIEEESPIPWDEFWDMTEDEFADRVRSLREGGMRHDDTTLLLLEVVPEVTEVEEPEVDEEEELEAVEGAVEEEREEETILAELADDAGEPVEEGPSVVEQELETAGAAEEEPVPSEEETDVAETEIAGEEREDTEVSAADSEAAEESGETAEEEASATKRTLEAGEQAEGGPSPSEEETDAAETVVPDEDVSEERDTS